MRKIGAPAYILLKVASLGLFATGLWMISEVRHSHDPIAGLVLLGAGVFFAPIFVAGVGLGALAWDASDPIAFRGIAIICGGLNLIALVACLAWTLFVTFRFASALV